MDEYGPVTADVIAIPEPSSILQDLFLDSRDRHGKKRPADDSSTAGCSDRSETMVLGLQEHIPLHDGLDILGAHNMSTAPKVNHSEIEKRRRDKLNTFIMELSTLVPMCSALNRKLDKLTVLRMAVQHMKIIRGTTALLTEGSHKPPFLSDEDLKSLMNMSVTGFLLVVSCDRGLLLYVSNSVNQVLGFDRTELMGQSIFDVVHPKDAQKIKEQLLASDQTPREKYIDAKTMLPVETAVPQKYSEMCSGVRRSFYCRIRTGSNSTSQTSTQLQKTSECKTYATLLCSGYIKTGPGGGSGADLEGESDPDGNLSSMVIVARLVPSGADLKHSQTQSVQYISRHLCDGKFSYVDNGVVSALGYLPQELIGTSIYEYCHPADIQIVKTAHGKVLKRCEKCETTAVRFKSKDRSFVRIKMSIEPFKNPWSHDIEYLVFRNTTVLSPEVSSSSILSPCSMGSEIINHRNSDVKSGQITEDELHVSHGGELQPEATRIGLQLAEEQLDMNVTLDSTSWPVESSSPLVSATVSYPFESPESSEMMPPPLSTQVVQSVSSGASWPSLDISSAFTESWTDNFVQDQPTEKSSTTLMGYNLESTSASASDSDDTAVAIIMSLLEADAGLGGPMDFSDLSWS